MRVNTNMHYNKISSFFVCVQGIMSFFNYTNIIKLAIKCIQISSDLVPTKNM